MNVVCLALDRLHIGYLGCYGNAWIETENIDRLAADGCVFDQFIADSVDLAVLYRSLWQGRHAATPDELPGDVSLPGLASAAERHSLLLTDEPLVADHPLSRGFDELVRLELPEAGAAAESLHDTRLFGFVAEAMHAVQACREPYFAWLHARALAAPWDAPFALRERFADEEDPDVPDFVAVPQEHLGNDFDPDLLLGIRQAYAGQIALVDACLGLLLDELPTDTALIVLGTRGMPLGEHGGVGDVPLPLHEELIHLPLIVRLPAGQAAVRSGALVQPGDLAATLADLLELPPDKFAWGQSLLPLVRGDMEQLRQCSLSQDDGALALRTSAWHFCDTRDAQHPQLFVKPDDRWEINNVIDRAGDLVDQLRQASRDFEAACASSPPRGMPPLPAELSEGLE